MTLREKTNLRRLMAEDPQEFYRSLIGKIRIFGIKREYYERLQFFFTRYPSYRNIRIFRRRKWHRLK